MGSSRMASNAAKIELFQKAVENGPAEGRDLRRDTGPGAVYYRLKDARAAARAQERSAEAAGEPAGVPSDWQLVRELATLTLTEQSKDLEIVTWLIEALVRLDGFAGLTLGFFLARHLIERFWPDIHSVDHDDTAGKLSPLAGLNGTGGEGVLVQPIRMVSLLHGAPYGSQSFWHYDSARRNIKGGGSAAFAAEVAGAPEALAMGARSAAEALEAFVALTKVLEEICGSDAPPSSNIRNVLIEVNDAYRALRGEPALALSLTPAPRETTGAPANGDDEEQAAAPQPQKEIRSRDEALVELLRVAAFFRKNEPHSPLAYALETLVERGQMSFMDLLAELLPDAATRSQFLLTAGIKNRANRAN